MSAFCAPCAYLPNRKVILKCQTCVKLTRPQLKTHIWGVQNTQDHFKGPHWMGVLTGSVSCVFDTHTP